MVDAGAERRERPAGEVDHLERAHDAAPVERLDAGRGDRIEILELAERVAQALDLFGRGLELGAPGQILAGDAQVVDDRPHVEAGAADEQRAPAPRLDVAQRGAPPAWVRATDQSSAGSATSTRWWTTAARSASVGLAVPMSMPRYTCIESSDTISTSPSSRASANASADFPDAVGPTSARWVMPGVRRRSLHRHGDAAAP